MNLNIFLIIIVSTLLLYLGLTFQKKEISNPVLPRLLVPLQVGKTHHIQSMTKDASMFTEMNRRRAIQSSGRFQKNKLKETRTSTGSTSGSIETFFLTSICPKLSCCSFDILFDGGNESANYCPILDDTGIGGEIVYDAGNENTTVCGV